MGKRGPKPGQGGRPPRDPCVKRAWERLLHRVILPRVAKELKQCMLPPHAFTVPDPSTSTSTKTLDFAEPNEEEGALGLPWVKIKSDRNDTRMIRRKKSAPPNAHFLGVLNYSYPGSNSSLAWVSVAGSSCGTGAPAVRSFLQKRRSLAVVVRAGALVRGPLSFSFPLRTGR